MSHSSEYPLVSIVVPTRNRSGWLGDCLTTLVSQDYPAERYEIVVVDDGSTDDTRKVVTEMTARTRSPSVRYLCHSGGVNAARNRGIAASSGSIVGFIDDDELAPSQLLGVAVKLLTDNPSAVAVGGEYRSRLEGKRPRFACTNCAENYKSIRAPRETRSAIVDDLPGGCVFLRRQAFEKYGLFAESLSGPGDDSEWFRRTREGDGTLLQSPELWIWHRMTERDFLPGSLVKKHVLGTANLVAARQLMGWESGVGDEVMQALRFLGHGLRRRCVVGSVRGLGQSALAVRWIQVTHGKRWENQRSSVLRSVMSALAASRLKKPARLVQPPLQEEKR